MRPVTKFKSALKPIKTRLMSELATPYARKALASLERPAQPTPFAVVFSDGPAGLYQLEQWLSPLKTLSRRVGPVTLIVSNAQTALKLRTLTNLRIHLESSASEVGTFVEQQAVQVIFYVNNNQANFTTLRINGPAHVHLSHGESEKSSMTSNQLKAYDFAFIAGQASQDRILSTLRRFDAAKLIQVGRPQLDLAVPAPSSPSGTLKAIPLLYAPTWEGDSPSMAYSSLTNQGRELCEVVLADHRFQLIYRPHPKLGSLSGAHRDADRHIRALIRKASSNNQIHGPQIELQGDPIVSIAAASVVATDISAMAMDSLGFNKPTVILLPKQASGASTAGLAMLDNVTTWQALPERALDELAELATTPLSERQREFREYVFGAEALGPATDRFVAAAAGLLEG